ncbi:MAG: chorismate mutase [Clostridia bacterium]|nr:chorismate mutase [Clostridia bacterium]
MQALDKARQDIDHADQTIAQAFEDRMRAVSAVAAYKKAHHLPILDSSREQEVLKKGEKHLKDGTLIPFFRQLQKHIIATSRTYQLWLDTKDSKAEKSLFVCHSQGGYPVFLGQAYTLALSPFFLEHQRILFVIDEGVPEKIRHSITDTVPVAHTLVMPRGEGSKSLERAAQICQYLTDHHFTRKDAIVALGGGVCCDLVGYVASIYLRGIAYYTFPSTLLAQADVAVGGKVAVNFAGAKNLLGQFYPPRAVCIVTDTLSSLSPREWNAGMAEIIKIALTCDKDLFFTIENTPKHELDLTELLYRALQLKACIVEQDEHETHLRRLLNFGHTLGHGIEAAQGLSGLLHVECVALGMLPMCSEAVRVRLLAVLEKFDLPTAYPFDIQCALDFVSKDKKAEGEEIFVVFLDDIATPRMEKMPISDYQAYILEHYKKD